jgi:YidC/Oxa1 family membrane protein insertase
MDNQRLILFVVFSFSLLLLWESWQSKHQPLAEPQAISQSVPNQPASSQTPAQTQSSVAPQAAALTHGQRAIVETDLIHAEIDSVGGDIRALQLENYRETDDKKQLLTLYEDSPDLPYVAQNGLIGAGLPTHHSVFQLTPGVYRFAQGASQIQVPLTWIDAASGLRVEKIYTFTRGSYQVDIQYRVSNNGTKAIDVSPYFQFMRHGKAPRGEAKMLYTFTGPVIYTDAQKFQKLKFKNIDDGSATYQKNATDGWTGFVQHHFVSAWLPAPGIKREFYVKALGNGLYANGVILNEGTLQPGQSKTFDVPLYAGPQLQKMLEATAPGLDLVRDYGWLTPLAFPIFWALRQIERIVGNWGWAIIILTVLIKLSLYPLSAAGYKSMAKMKKLNPRLQRLKELHSDDRQKLHLAMAELYKTEKINPLGGCLPIVIQIPVFIALYWVLLAAVEMRGAPWIGWITDLTAPDPFYILPIIMGITSVLQVKLNPQPMDPMQAKIMMIMPIGFTVMFFFFPAGLVLYWVVNNSLSILQQWAINRQVEGGAKLAKT